MQLEAHIRRHPAGLDGGQVRAGDAGAGEHLADVDGPGAGAGADVEDGLGAGADGREEVVASEGFVDGPELHVEAVLFELVVGEDVGVAVAAEGVVCSAIALLEKVFGRGDGTGAACD